LQNVFIHIYLFYRILSYSTLL